MDLLSAVTFLFTDIEGSTRLWEDHPEAIAEHDQILGEVIEGHGGRVFSTAGDAFAAVFPSALGAVEAAIAAQTGAGSLVAGGEPVRVRQIPFGGPGSRRDVGRVPRWGVAGRAGIAVGP